MGLIQRCTLCATIIFLFYEVFSKTHNSLELIPERAELTFTNEKYVLNNSFNVRRYSRRSGYVVNIWGIHKHEWGNNVTIDITIYEYLHNEYKPSFIEFHFKLCDLINKDEYIGGSLRQRGITCPFSKGFVGVTNVTLIIPSFPYVFPFTKFKAHLVFKTLPSHDTMTAGDLYFSVKQISVICYVTLYFLVDNSGKDHMSSILKIMVLLAIPLQIIHGTLLFLGALEDKLVALELSLWLCLILASYNTVLGVMGAIYYIRTGHITMHFFLSVIFALLALSLFTVLCHDILIVYAYKKLLQSPELLELQVPTQQNNAIINQQPGQQ